MLETLTEGARRAGSPDAGNPDGGGSAVRVDVNGRVMDLAGQVKDGTWVVIKSGSFRATPTVDSEGNFTVASVPIPYDVWVIVEGTSPWDYLRNATTAPMEVGVTASLGLQHQSQSHAARFDETYCHPSTANLASISGRVSGGIGFPTPDDYWTAVAFSSPTGSSGMLSGDTTTVSSTTGAYVTDVRWSGPSTTSGTLHALQWQRGSGGPASYSGYGVASVPLTDAPRAYGAWRSLARR